MIIGFMPKIKKQPEGCFFYFRITLRCDILSTPTWGSPLYCLLKAQGFLLSLSVRLQRPCRCFLQYVSAATTYGTPWCCVEKTGGNSVSATSVSHCSPCCVQGTGRTLPNIGWAGACDTRAPKFRLLSGCIPLKTFRTQPRIIVVSGSCLSADVQETRHCLRRPI